MSEKDWMRTGWSADESGRERNAEDGRGDSAPGDTSALLETGADVDRRRGDPAGGTSRYGGTVSDGRITLGKCIGHFRTVTHHRMLVAEGCFKVGLYGQGLTHDLSKFSPVEFLNSVRFYQYGKQSPNNGERVVKGYSESWIHHKGHNRHHYEHWTDYNVEAAKKGEFPVRPVQMPRRFVAEMLMDRIAASKTYMKDK